MSEEIKYLREYLKDILQYKGLQEELTYDIPLQMLKRICIVLDYLKQENQQLKKDAEFEKAYVRSLRKIIYRLYMNIELSTREFATLRQAVEENEVTND